MNSTNGLTLRLLIMNDRIKQLAEKSLCIKEGEFSFNGGEVELVDLKKFAELIVKECAEWVNDNVGLIDEKAKSDLLKHFGVEE